MNPYKQILTAFLGLCALSYCYSMQTPKIPLHETVFDFIPDDQRGTLLQYMNSFKQAKDNGAKTSAAANAHDCEYRMECSLSERNATRAVKDIIEDCLYFLYDDCGITCDHDTVYHILCNPILRAKLGDKEATNRLASYTVAETRTDKEASDTEKRKGEKTVSFATIEQ